MAVEGVEVKDKPTLRQIDSLVSRLRRRQVVGAQETALETALLLRQIVSTARFTRIEHLISLIKGVARKLIDAQPKELAVGNIVRRVLRLIREENAAAIAAAEAELAHSLESSPGSSVPTTPYPAAPTFPNIDPHAGFPLNNVDIPIRPKMAPTHSLANFVALGNQSNRPSITELQQPSAPRYHRAEQLGWEESKRTHAVTVKPLLIQAIQEVIDELETVYENVAKNAKDQIYDGEIILTIGHSRTTEQFLKSAAKDRSFTVIVAETAPLYTGRLMATALSASSIPTVLIPDSSIFALMPRITKLILGAHAILANGGLFAPSGSFLAASAARAHSTPVVVCAGQFKLTPVWNLYHEHAALDFAGPEKVLSFEDGGGGEERGVPWAVMNPIHDYVKPELVDVLITNDGDHPPPYVYRLIKETYDDEDINL